MAWLTTIAEVDWVAIATGVLVPATLAFIAWRVANTWQRREVTLRLLDELNSPEMMEARASAIELLTRLEKMKVDGLGQRHLTKDHFRELVSGWLIFDKDKDGAMRDLK
jgi:hypothetical protein